MTFEQFIGPLGGAVIALLGVGLTLFFTSLQKRRDRRHEYAVELVKQRIELYVEYLGIMNDSFEMDMSSQAIKVRATKLLLRLAPLERRMQLLAVNQVLKAFTQHRRLIRDLARFHDIDELFQLQKLVLETRDAEMLSISMMRADLNVDSFDSKWRRFRRLRRSERLLDAAYEDSVQAFAESVVRAMQMQPDAFEKSQPDGDDD